MSSLNLHEGSATTINNFHENNIFGTKLFKICKITAAFVIILVGNRLNKF